MTERYFLKADWSPWVEVTKVVWVRAERNAGFHNTLGRPDEPGTGGFSGGGTQGRIINGNADPEGYAWDPEFCKVAWPS